MGRIHVAEALDENLHLHILFLYFITTVTHNITHVREGGVLFENKIN